VRMHMDESADGGDSLLDDDPPLEGEHLSGRGAASLPTPPAD
jgi:hypothetical protein